MADIIIYGLHASPFVRKTLIFAEEKAVDVEFQEANPFAPADWFLEINPAKRIPVMRDRRVGTEGAQGTIPDSSAICAYLEARCPAPALYPADPFDRGRAVWIEEYADSELAGTIGLGIFRPVFFSLFAGKEPDADTARQCFNQKLPPIFDYLDSQLAEREFFSGQSLSIADIGVVVQLQALELAGGHVDSERWPQLAGLQQRLSEREAFARAIEAARATLPPHGVRL